MKSPGEEADNDCRIYTFLSLCNYEDLPKKNMEWM